MSQLFTSGGQSIGASASALVLPVNIQDWFPLGWLVGSPCSPRDSQESSPAPQFRSINSSSLSLFYGPALAYIYDYLKNHMFVLVAQSCMTLCNPMDCSPPGSSVHEILQTRILEWVAISLSRGSSRPRDQTQVSSNPGECFTIWATRKTMALTIWSFDGKVASWHFGGKMANWCRCFLIRCLGWS